mmetsp:Transcript_41974/g.98484  ORF Transcript_41974/g.98484 Transcript_41974/m.98484 type:complete len:204 (+) Transcript_41974:149-760(+)
MPQQFGRRFWQTRTERRDRVPGRLRCHLRRCNGRFRLSFDVLIDDGVSVINIAPVLQSFGRCRSASASGHRCLPLIHLLPLAEHVCHIRVVRCIRFLAVKALAANSRRLHHLHAFDGLSSTAPAAGPRALRTLDRCWVGGFWLPCHLRGPIHLRCAGSLTARKRAPAVASGGALRRQTWGGHFVLRLNLSGSQPVLASLAADA